MKARGIAAGACLCIAASLLLGGTAPLGRVFLAVGAPTLARPLLPDPDWRGVAAYRAGDFADAATAFGRGAGGLNLGNALAMDDRYAAALEAYDTVRGADPVAAANFDLVSAFYAGLGLEAGSIVAFGDRDGDTDAVAAPIGEGQGRAAASGDGVTNTGTLLGLPELRSTGEIGTRKVFDDRFVAADARWLATLADVPGDYLAARIEFERKRRRDLGLSPPAPEDPR